MKVTIDEKTAEIIKSMLKEQNKTAVRIAKTGVACGGIQKEIVMDEEKENDDVVVDHGIKIVADKSISFFFTSALITHKEGINGIRFKIV